MNPTDAKPITAKAVEYAREYLNSGSPVRPCSYGSNLASWEQLARDLSTYLLRQGFDCTEYQARVLVWIAGARKPPLTERLRDAKDVVAYVAFAELTRQNPYLTASAVRVELKKLLKVPVPVPRVGRIQIWIRRANETEEYSKFLRDGSGPTRSPPPTDGLSRQGVRRGSPDGASRGRASTGSPRAHSGGEASSPSCASPPRRRHRTLREGREARRLSASNLPPTTTGPALPPHPPRPSPPVFGAGPAHCGAYPRQYALAPYLYLGPPIFDPRLNHYGHYGAHQGQYTRPPQLLHFFTSPPVFGTGSSHYGAYPGSVVQASASHVTPLAPLLPGLTADTVRWMCSYLERHPQQGANELFQTATQYGQRCTEKQAELFLFACRDRSIHDYAVQHGFNYADSLATYVRVLELVGCWKTKRDNNNFAWLRETLINERHRGFDPGQLFCWIDNAKKIHAERTRGEV